MLTSGATLDTLPKGVFPTIQRGGSAEEGEEIGPRVEELLGGEGQVAAEALGDVLGVEERGVDRQVRAAVHQDATFDGGEDGGGGDGRRVGVADGAQEDSGGRVGGDEGGVTDGLARAGGEEIAGAEGELGAAGGGEGHVRVVAFDLESIDAPEVEAGIAQCCGVAGDPVGGHGGEHARHVGGVDAVGRSAINVGEGEIAAGSGAVGDGVGGEGRDRGSGSTGDEVCSAGILDDSTLHDAVGQGGSCREDHTMGGGVESSRAGEGEHRAARNRADAGEGERRVGRPGIVEGDGVGAPSGGQRAESFCRCGGTIAGVSQATSGQSHSARRAADASELGSCVIDIQQGVVVDGDVAGGTGELACAADVERALRNDGCGRIGNSASYVHGAGSKLVEGSGIGSKAGKVNDAGAHGVKERAVGEAVEGGGTKVEGGTVGDPVGLIEATGVGDGPVEGVVAAGRENAAGAVDPAHKTVASHGLDDWIREGDAPFKPKRRTAQSHADHVDLPRTDVIGIVHDEDTSRDVGYAGAGRVVGVDAQGAEVVLLKSVGGSAEGEGRVEGGGGAGGHVDADGGGVEANGAAGKRVGAAAFEAKPLGAGVGGEADHVGAVSKRSIASDGKNTAGHINDGAGAAERVGGVAQLEGAVAGLGDDHIRGTCGTTSDLTRDFHAVHHVGVTGTASDVEGGTGRRGQG